MKESDFVSLHRTSAHGERSGLRPPYGAINTEHYIRQTLVAQKYDHEKGLGEKPARDSVLVAFAVQAHDIKLISI